MHVIKAKQQLKKIENKWLVDENKDPNRQHPYSKILYRFTGALPLLSHLIYRYNNLRFYGTFCNVKAPGANLILSTEICSTGIMILSVESIGV